MDNENIEILQQETPDITDEVVDIKVQDKSNYTSL